MARTNAILNASPTCGSEQMTTVEPTGITVLRLPSVGLPKLVRRTGCLPPRHLVCDRLHHGLARGHPGQPFTIHVTGEILLA